MQKRRQLLTIGALGTLIATGLIPHSSQAASLPLVEVWKSPTCGCCKDWIIHLEKHGFQVRTYDTGNTEAREKLGMPLALGSCHTAKIGNYAIEGHVPAREILRLLKEKPNAIGLAVPAMPLGSPGMDGPAFQNRSQPYEVLLVAKDGGHSVYQAYP